MPSPPPSSSSSPSSPVPGRSGPGRSGRSGKSGRPGRSPSTGSSGATALAFSMLVSEWPSPKSATGCGTSMRALAVAGVSYGPMTSMAGKSPAVAVEIASAEEIPARSMLLFMGSVRFPKHGLDSRSRARVPAPGAARREIAITCNVRSRLPGARQLHSTERTPCPSLPSCRR